jgi:hypothetical protein
MSPNELAPSLKRRRRVGLSLRVLMLLVLLLGGGLGWWSYRARVQAAGGATWLDWPAQI